MGIKVVGVAYTRGDERVGCCGAAEGLLRGHHPLRVSAWTPGSIWSLKGSSGHGVILVEGGGVGGARYRELIREVIYPEQRILIGN